MTNNSAPDLSIVIVSYNSGRLLLKCISSLYAHTQDVSKEVILVDNASKDEIIPELRIKFPEVKIVVNSRNRGFASASNQGLRLAQGNWILFLNPDTASVQPGIGKLIECLKQNSDIGLLGCKLINEDGTLQPSCIDFPSLKNLFIDHMVRHLPVSEKLKGQFLCRFWNHGTAREVDWVLGAFMLMPKSVANRLDGFDEIYFPLFGGEDMDLCYQIKKLGLKVFFTPEYRVIHKGHPNVNVELRSVYYKNLYSFYKKHYHFYHRFILRFYMAIIFFGAAIVRGIVALLFNQSRKAKESKESFRNFIWSLTLQNHLRRK